MPKSFDLVTNPHALPLASGGVVTGRLPMRVVPDNPFIFKRDPADEVRVHLYTMRKHPRTDDMRQMLDDLGIEPARDYFGGSFRRMVARHMHESYERMVARHMHESYERLARNGIRGARLVDNLVQSMGKGDLIAALKAAYPTGRFEE